MAFVPGNLSIGGRYGPVLFEAQRFCWCHAQGRREHERTIACLFGLCPQTPPTSHRKGLGYVQLGKGPDNIARLNQYVCPFSIWLPLVSFSLPFCQVQANFFAGRLYVWPMLVVVRAARCRAILALACHQSCGTCDACFQIRPCFP